MPNALLLLVFLTFILLHSFAAGIEWFSGFVYINSLFIVIMYSNIPVWVSSLLSFCIIYYMLLRTFLVLDQFVD